MGSIEGEECNFEQAFTVHFCHFVKNYTQNQVAEHDSVVLILSVEVDELADHRDGTANVIELDQSHYAHLVYLL